MKIEEKIGQLGHSEKVFYRWVPVRPEILSEVYRSPNFISRSVWIPGEFFDPNTIAALSKFNKFLVVQRHDFFNGVIQADYVRLLQRELDMTTAISPQFFPAKLSWMLNREYQKWYVDYAKSLDTGVPHHDWYVRQFGSFVPSPLEPLFYDPFLLGIIVFLLILIIGLVFILRKRSWESFVRRFKWYMSWVIIGRFSFEFL